jgi:glycosyltransferase involved in cell wall biosynthesis
VGIYLQNLVQGLAGLDRENEYHLFSSSWKERFPSTVYPSNFRIHDRHWPVRVLNYCWNHLSTPSIERLVGSSLDVAHSSTPLVMPTKKARKVTTVYDLYFFKNPQGAVREMQTDFPGKVKEHSLRSDAIIAISDYTKKQLIELLEIPSSRIYTIKLGVDEFFQQSASSEEKKEILRKFQIPGPFLLFVGTQEPRKNLPLLIEAFRNLRDNLYLVLAGPEGWNLQPEKLSADRVISTGYLPQKDLRALYQQASAVVFPSIDEGFGLPLLEGMASGVPVIASRIPVFQEVCNDSCAYFDPTSAEDLRDQIQAVLEQNELREKLIAKGKMRVQHFSWKETAQKTLALYSSL